MFADFLRSQLLSPFPQLSASRHPFPASNLLMLKFALDVRCDPQFSALPKSIHFTGEVLGELG